EHSSGPGPGGLLATSAVGPQGAPIPEERREDRGQRASHWPAEVRRRTRVTVAPGHHQPPIHLRRLTGRRAGHHNLTSWFPSVHIPFARRYRRRGQTVLAHHGLQADRPSEAALIAAGKRSTEYAASLQTAGHCGGGFRRRIGAYPRRLLLIEQQFRFRRLVRERRRVVLFRWRLQPERHTER